MLSVRQIIHISQPKSFNIYYIIIIVSLMFCFVNNEHKLQQYNYKPCRILMVRRISLGMTTLPRSSMRLTIPVAFILFPPIFRFVGIVCAENGRSFIFMVIPLTHHKNIDLAELKVVGGYLFVYRIFSRCAKGIVIIIFMKKVNRPIIFQNRHQLFSQDCRLQLR